MKLFYTQFPPFSCHFLSLRFEYAAHQDVSVEDILVCKIPKFFTLLLRLMRILGNIFAMVFLVSEVVQFVSVTCILVQIFYNKA
jgi:hypothetical protein